MGCKSFVTLAPSIVAKMSLNPFGEAVIPRSLDNERLFAAWFQLADAGACRRLAASAPLLSRAVKRSARDEAWEQERKKAAAARLFFPPSRFCFLSTSSTSSTSAFRLKPRAPSLSQPCSKKNNLPPQTTTASSPGPTRSRSSSARASRARRWPRSGRSPTPAAEASSTGGASRRPWSSSGSRSGPGRTT